MKLHKIRVEKIGSSSNPSGVSRGDWFEGSVENLPEVGRSFYVFPLTSTNRMWARYLRTSKVLSVEDHNWGCYFTTESGASYKLEITFNEQGN
jgi:hypothetical protein